MAKDVVCVKLKVYGYTSFFTIVINSVVQFISLPFSIFTVGSKFKKFTIVTTKIGIKISKEEMGIIKWAWIGVDLILFGEPVSITDESNFAIIYNETIRKLAETIKELATCELFHLYHVPR